MKVILKKNWNVDFVYWKCRFCPQWFASFSIKRANQFPYQSFHLMLGKYKSKIPNRQFKKYKYKYKYNILNQFPYQYFLWCWDWRKSVEQERENHQYEWTLDHRLMLPPVPWPWPRPRPSPCPSPWTLNKSFALLWSGEIWEKYATIEADSLISIDPCILP